MHPTTRMHPWRAGFAAACLLVSTLHAQQGPSLAYLPPPGPGSTISFPVSTGTPVESLITVVPTGGAPGLTTTLVCFFRTQPLTFTVRPSVATFTDTERMLAVGCTPSINGPEVGTLECLETIESGPQATRTWPLFCPSWEPAPGFSSIPANGQTIVLGAAPGTQANGGPVFGNPGLLAYSISTCAVTGSGFTMVSMPPLTIPAGASVPLNVACTTPAQVGTTINGSLDCQTSVFGVNPSYPLQCTAIVPPPDPVFTSSFEADEAPL